MHKELKVASHCYVKIAQLYEELVEECTSLEFIAINAGIASKQANSDSFMKLSNEIQSISSDVTQSAIDGRDTSLNALHRITETFANLTMLLRQNELFQKAFNLNSKLSPFYNKIQNKLMHLDLKSVRKDASKMNRALANLLEMVNIGKTMAIGGRIKAVYIVGNEEKFRLITDTMQESIDRLYNLLEKINEQFDIIRAELSTRSSIES